ncbi:MAG: alpha/beta hydrolase [Candidatus Binataceae bacterium]|nr:alpha/beta hydrolase [Candidatus Binataceae bacterium]
MEKLNVRGVEVQFVREGGGRPLLLLDSGFSFEHDFVSRLARHFDVIAPSHPGFMGSPRPGDIDSIDDLAYLYLDMMRQLGLREVTLAGFSMGGWIAAEIAIRSSDRLSQLVLVDSFGIKVSDRETPDIADMFAIGEEDLMRLLFHEPQKFKIDMNGLSEERLAIVAQNRAALALFNWEPYAHNPKLLNWLGRIDIPTLVVWGQNDGLVKADYGRKFAAAIPGAKFETIANCGHLPHLECPEILLQHVTTFAAKARNR